MEAGDWIWIWIGAAIAFATAELVTPFLFFMISFAAGAVAAAVVSALDGSVGLQWALFVLASAGALAVLVPIGRRLALKEGDEAQEGATRWIGRTAVVLQDIEPHDTGLVRLERAEWRAETDAGTAIPAGARVEVLAVRGTRLVVAPPHELEPPR